MSKAQAVVWLGALVFLTGVLGGAFALGHSVSAHGNHILAWSLFGWAGALGVVLFIGALISLEY